MPRIGQNLETAPGHPEALSHAHQTEATFPEGRGNSVRTEPDTVVDHLELGFGFEVP